MKWTAIKNNGKYVRAGFCTFDLAAGDTAEEYDDVVPSIVSAIQSAQTQIRTAASLEADLKAKGVL